MELEKQLKHCLPLDVETTGLDPTKHGMLSLGVKLFNGAEFYEENYLREGIEIHPKALAVNGENEANLLARDESNYNSEYQTLCQLIDFCEEHDSWVIIGKNPKFDYNFLLEIWKRNGGNEREFPFTYRVINYGDFAIPLMILEGMVVPPNGFSSSDIQNYLEIPEEPKPHNALNGAKYNVECVTRVLEKMSRMASGVYCSGT